MSFDFGIGKRVRAVQVAVAGFFCGGREGDIELDITSYNMDSFGTYAAITSKTESTAKKEK